jgi:hypothetical protein
MSDPILYSKIEMLQSDGLKKDLWQYIEFFLTKQAAQPTKKIPVFGAAKGIFKMAGDFDEPLDDFKEYMPD